MVDNLLFVGIDFILNLFCIGYIIYLMYFYIKIGDIIYFNKWYLFEYMILYVYFE